LRNAAESVHLVAAVVGFLSYFFIWLAVVWGLILRNGWGSTRMRHSMIFGIHHVVATLGLTLATVHAATQLAVPEGPIRVVDVVVPFTNVGDSVGIGVGVIGLELMIASALSILIQKKLGYSRWRALHALNYVAYTLVTGHILLSGTDMGIPYLWTSVLFAWLMAVVLWISTTTPASRARRAVRESVGMPVSREPDVTVGVDAGLCARYGFCEHEAPDVFKLTPDGRIAYRASVPADAASEVVRAAQVCPRRAIKLGRVPTAVISAAQQPAEAAPPPRAPQPSQPPRGPQGPPRLQPARPPSPQQWGQAPQDPQTQPPGLRGVPATVTGLRDRAPR
jgi:ferredoxin